MSYKDWNWVDKARRCLARAAQTRADLEAANASRAEALLDVEAADALLTQVSAAGARIVDSRYSSGDFLAEESYEEFGDWLYTIGSERTKLGEILREEG